MERSVRNSKRGILWYAFGIALCTFVGILYFKSQTNPNQDSQRTYIKPAPIEMKEFEEDRDQEASPGSEPLKKTSLEERSSNLTESSAELPSFTEFVAAYEQLSDDEITDSLIDLEDELEKRDLLRTSRDELPYEERRDLTLIMRKSNALKVVRAKRELAIARAQIEEATPE